MVLGYKFAIVQRKKRKIKEVFDICKVAAEKKGYKIFGIRVSAKVLSLTSFIRLRKWPKTYSFYFHFNILNIS